MENFPQFHCFVNAILMTPLYRLPNNKDNWFVENQHLNSCCYKLRDLHGLCLPKPHINNIKEVLFV